MPDAAIRQVLYVEDDRINIILMEEAMRGLPGWSIHVAEDGAHALQQLSEGSLPDLVLIDMHLPDMNGIDLLARIRRDVRLRQLHCIAMSADDEPLIVRAALDAGFSDFWLKPVSAQKFRSFA